MTEPAKAVFLSYASQDVAAAARICDALRAAGIEVWFDQSELRGGDAWDRQIRKQIHDCALFIPLISQHSQERLEGYFRLEWKLAVDRSHRMAAERSFIVPVVVDSTRERDALVPDSFRDVQWTQLPGGQASPPFVARVAALLSASATVATNRPSPALASRPPAQTRRRPALWIALGLAPLAIIVGGGWFALQHSGPHRHTQADATGQSPPAVSEKSIAVLPFVDLSEKKDQEYFSDGLSEELIDLLAKVPDLRVPARTSSFFFKGKSEDIATIAQKLHVANVLEGSVRKAANTIRVTAQLIRADNGYHLWSETYDRDLKDVFKVQDEIAGAVVSTLKLKLAPGQQPSNSHRTSNIEAYNQYLLGRRFFERGTDDGFRRARGAYRKAIELDPSYAAAYAGLAIANNTARDAAELQEGLAAANKAVLLAAPDESDGYVARAVLRAVVSWDWAGAQEDFEKALAIDPVGSDVQLWYGVLLDNLGRLPEAIVAAKKAIELDPLSSVAWVTLGWYLTEDRQFAAAHEATRRALEIQPENAFALNNLGRLQLLEGNAADALVTFRKADDDGLQGIAIAEHMLSHPKESQQALDRLIAQDHAFGIAGVYASRGEKDKAFEWLDRAYQQHDPGMGDIKDDVLLASLHGDPRYKALLRKMKLPE